MENVIRNCLVNIVRLQTATRRHFPYSIKVFQPIELGRPISMSFMLTPKNYFRFCLNNFFQNIPDNGMLLIILMMMIMMMMIIRMMI